MDEHAFEQCVREAESARRLFKNAAGFGVEQREVVQSCIARAQQAREDIMVHRSPPPRTKWTRRVPHPVLIGHAASLTPY